MRPLCISKGCRLRHAARSSRTWAPCTCFRRFRNDSLKMQGCLAEFTAHVRFELTQQLIRAMQRLTCFLWTCQCRTALSCRTCRHSALRSECVLRCSIHPALGLKADGSSRFVVEVSFVACSTVAAETLVEKANLDTVCQAHGQRLRSIDLLNRLSQRVIVLGVLSGKEVEAGDMGTCCES